MSETFIVRDGPILRVRINGVLDTLCLSAEATFGFNLRVATATALFPRAPSAREWDWIDMEMGPDLAGAATRFAGYVVQIRHDLYPNAVALLCRGTLVRAERMQGEETDADPDGIDLSNGGLGQTDEAMVTEVLTRCGVPELNIAGTGHNLGTVALDQFLWTSGQSGLSMVEDIEEATLGYRTFNAPAGACVRRKIAGSPAGSAALTFTEGVDIEQADQESSILEVYNEVQVTGFDDGTGLGPVIKTLRQDSPFLPSGISTVRREFSSAKIEQENAADVGDGLSCEEVAEWQLGEYNRKLSRVTFTTPRADRLFPGMTIEVDAPGRLGVSRKYWLQEVKTEINEQGVFSQHLTCLGGFQSNAPVDDDEVIEPLADFTVLVEVESVVISGAETTLYTVFCRDTSFGVSGEISSRAWSASGGNPTSGSDETFTSVYTSLAGESISLTVTDANGRTNERSKSLEDAAPASNHVVRRLFAAAGGNFEVFDGSTWRVDAPSSGSVTVVAHGPLAAAGDTFLATADDLATSATESQPLGAGVDVTSIWTELDADASQVLIGGSNGQIGYSTDGGTTFTVKAGPTATSIVKVIISRFTPGQLHVLTGDGWYVSDNYGDNWRTIRAAASGQTFQDLVLSHTRNVIASVVTGAGAALEQAEDGTAFTFPVSVTDVYAVTAHIREDRFYCYDSAGQTFYTSADGGTVMAQGADLPTAAQAQKRGLWRDGEIVDLLYVANGTAGLYKSIDGLQTSGGYYALRTPGVGNSAAGADYAMVGADGNLLTADITPVTLLSAAGTGKILELWNGSGNDAPPDGWRDLSFDDSGWSATIEVTGSGTIPTGSERIWHTDRGASANSGEEAVYRHEFTLSDGTVSVATLEVYIDDEAVGIWINNALLYQGDGIDGLHDGSGSFLTINVDPALLITGNDNVLAIHAADTGGGWVFIAYRLEIS